MSSASGAGGATSDAALEKLLTTPRKKLSEGKEVGSIVASVTGQADRDIEYVLTQLRESDAGLPGYVAGLLRDKVLQKAWKLSQNIAPTALGKKLPSKLK